jgi:hypothetical protein
MARNSNTETAGTGKPTRKFGKAVANVPTAAPTIVDGIYVGTLKNIKADDVDRSASAISGVEGLKLFDVVEKIDWDTENKTEAGKSTRINTGEYYIQGAITYGVELTSTDEVPLPMDTMNIYGGRVNIIFDQDEDGNWDISTKSNEYGVLNATWNGFRNATGLDAEKLEFLLEAVPEDEYNKEFEVPERLEGVEGVQDMLAAVAFYQYFFTLVAQEVSGKEVKVKVARRNRYNSEDLENVVNVGFNKKGYANYTSCGLLPVDA